MGMGGGDWGVNGGVWVFSVRCSLFAVMGLLVVGQGRDGKMPSLVRCEASRSSEVKDLGHLEPCSG